MSDKILLQTAHKVVTRNGEKTAVVDLLDLTNRYTAQTSVYSQYQLVNKYVSEVLLNHPKIGVQLIGLSIHASKVKNAVESQETAYVDLSEYDKNLYIFANLFILNDDGQLDGANDNLHTYLSNLVLFNIIKKVEYFDLIQERSALLVVSLM